MVNLAFASQVDPLQLVTFVGAIVLFPTQNIDDRIENLSKVSKYGELFLLWPEHPKPKHVRSLLSGMFDRPKPSS